MTSFCIVGVFMTLNSKKHHIMNTYDYPFIPHLGKFFKYAIISSFDDLFKILVYKLFDRLGKFISKD